MRARLASASLVCLFSLLTPGCDGGNAEEIVDTAPLDDADAPTADAEDAPNEADAPEDAEVGADALDALDALDAWGDADAGADADEAGDADAADAADAAEAAPDAYPWPTACTSCHGTAGVNPAPPTDTNAETATTAPGVGAHQKHLTASGWHRDVECPDCHVVPSKTLDPSVPTHLNSVNDVVWGPVAKRGTYDKTARTCTNVWCHGGPPQPDHAGTIPATVRAPLWTAVDGTQSACGKACHTTPPGGGHPDRPGCEGCHPDVISSFKAGVGGAPPTVVWNDAQLHINGNIEWLFPLECTTCHGNPARGAGDPAPPRGPFGETATTDPAVGAHQSHLSKGLWHRDVQCADCHTVPTSMMHTNGALDLSWSGPAVAGGATPSFSNTAVTCSGVWCHGAKLSGGTVTTPEWNLVDKTQSACGTCHGLPPSVGHPQNRQCNLCHAAVIKSCPPNDPAKCEFQPDASPTQSYKLHVNGKVDVTAGGKCDGCHGAPPPNGAHVAHASGADLPTAYGSLEPRTNATSYAFNCGYCHPLDVSRHMDGKLDVELYDPSAPKQPSDPNAQGDRKTLKGLSPTAAYTAGTTTFNGTMATYTDGTCANVYCHSAEVPLVASVPYPTSSSAPTFAWKSVTPFADVEKDQCCTGTADDYPDFAIDVTRRFASPRWVGETHAGPEKCAHCHAYPPRAAPPENAGAGQGHAWMDDGFENGHFYNMGKGWPIQCRRCHSGTVAAYLPDADYHYEPASDGIVFDKAMTIADFTMHLNGRKDVQFDLSPTTCGKASPDLRYGSIPCLQTAKFDPATRTCTNVECHISQTKQTWGAPFRYSVMAECNSCHAF